MEVVVALLILVVGILGAVALQSNALVGTRTAANVQDLTNVAQGELELRARDTSILTASASTGLSCLTQTSKTFADAQCSVAVFPCSYASNALVCSSGTVADPPAHEVRVTASSGGRSVILSTVVR